MLVEKNDAVERREMVENDVIKRNILDCVGD